MSYLFIHIIVNYLLPFFMLLKIYFHFKIFIKLIKLIKFIKLDHPILIKNLWNSSSIIAFFSAQN